MLKLKAERCTSEIAAQRNNNADRARESQKVLNGLHVPAHRRQGPYRKERGRMM